MPKVFKLKKHAEPKKPRVKKSLTRQDILGYVAKDAEITFGQATAVMQSLAKLLHHEMSKKGSGAFIVPMVGIKVRRVKKTARKARNMVSPLTGTEVTIPAKPAHVKVKMSALKPLKDSVLN